MNKMAVLVFSGLAFLAGVLFSGVALKTAAPEAFIKEIRSPFDFPKTLAVLKSRIEKQPGWKVIAEIDQREILVNAGQPDIGPYRILKICHAGYASRMLEASDRKFFGASLPISLAVYEKDDGRVYLSLINGALLSNIYGGTIRQVATRVRLEIEDVLAFVKFKFTYF